MKIKTITCHNVYNVGASLQAFALTEYLKGKGHEVEIIDYVPDYLNHFPLWGCASEKYNKPFIRELYSLAKYPERVKDRRSERKCKFDKFALEHLPLTTMHYGNNSELYANPPEADIIFAGSDQIWNSLFKNGRDSAFYLDFAKKNTVRAAYAASFAIEDIPAEMKKQVKSWLDKMDFISVREKSGLEIIKKLGIEEACCVVDPVFLLPDDFWGSQCIDMEISEPYIFVYDFDSNFEIEKLAKTEAVRLDAKIITYQDLEYSDTSFCNADPIEFISLIKGAECVISNSFHGTAFALIFNKPFWVFGREESINTRMRDLVNELGISERFVEKANTNYSEDICYTSINRKLNEMIRFSQDFIDTVLHETEKQIDERREDNNRT